MEKQMETVVEKAVAQLMDDLVNCIRVHDDRIIDWVELEGLFKATISQAQQEAVERMEEEIMMLFVDVDAGGQVSEKEQITIDDVRELFEALQTNQLPINPHTGMEGV